jgi:hypothetical protein
LNLKCCDILVSSLCFPIQLVPLQRGELAGLEREEQRRVKEEEKTLRRQRVSARDERSVRPPPPPPTPSKPKPSPSPPKPPKAPKVGLCKLNQVDP